MIRNFKIIFIFLLLLLGRGNYAQEKEIVAYYPGFSSRTRGYIVKDIERRGSADKVTIINYAFAVPAPDSSGNIFPRINSIAGYQEIYSGEMSIDGTADDSTQSLRGNLNQLRKLKKKYPHIKLLLSIGGYGGSKYFSDAALTPESREHFVNTCIDIFISGNLPLENGAGGKGSAQNLFDGFDLDWEFPIEGGPEGTHYNPNDRENNTSLLKLFREKLDSINSSLLLTAAVSARTWEFWKYNFSEDQKYLDFFNVMTYDYHGSWEPATGHHTNLLSSPYDPDGNKESLDHTVRYLIDSAGVGRDKIVPGAAFYGKGWMDVDSANYGLYRPGKPLTGKPYVHFNNYADYPEIKKEGFQFLWDNPTMSGWLYNSGEKIFWTYDDIRSVVLKARYVDAHNLRGLMFWAINGDDSLGNLVDAIYNRNMPDIKIKNKSGNNVIQTLRILKPFPDSIFHTGSDVIIIPDLQSNDSTIAKIEYFVDEHSIGYNTMHPFSWVWFNAESGEHKLSALIAKKDGVKSNSNIVKIKVEKK